MPAQENGTEGACVKRTIYLTRCTGVISGAAIFVVNIFQFLPPQVALTVANPPAMIRCLWYLLFGLLMVASQLRLFRYLSYFSFLKSDFGRGMFFIYVGTIFLGGQWYFWVVGAVTAFTGILDIMTSCGVCGKPPRSAYAETDVESQPTAQAQPEQKSSWWGGSKKPSAAASALAGDQPLTAAAAVTTVDNSSNPFHGNKHLHR